MKKVEWMPVNPCPCGAIRYPDSHKCNDGDDGTCTLYARYAGGRDYQKKLLEYLIKLAVNKKLIIAIWEDELQSMLKTMEGK